MFVPRACRPGRPIRIAVRITPLSTLYGGGDGPRHLDTQRNALPTVSVPRAAIREEIGPCDSGELEAVGDGRRREARAAARSEGGTPAIFPM